MSVRPPAPWLAVVHRSAVHRSAAVDRSASVEQALGLELVVWAELDRRASPDRRDPGVVAGPADSSPAKFCRINLSAL
jgi:hypothetical protein